MLFHTFGSFYLSLTVYVSTFWCQLKSAVLHWKVYTWAAILCGVGSTRKQEEEEIISYLLGRKLVGPTNKSSGRPEVRSGRYYIFYGPRRPLIIIYIIFPGNRSTVILAGGSVSVLIRRLIKQYKKKFAL